MTPHHQQAMEKLKYRYDLEEKIKEQYDILDFFWRNGKIPGFHLNNIWHEHRYRFISTEELEDIHKKNTSLIIQHI